MNGNTEIIATFTPDLEMNGLCDLSLKYTIDGKEAAELTAARFCDKDFDLNQDADKLYRLFDENIASAYASGLAKDVKIHSQQISKILGNPKCFGFLGIIEINVQPKYRESGITKELICYLQELHEGLDWLVGLQAVPIELLEGPEDAFDEMQKRLIDHYSLMGFLQPAQENAPHFLVAQWGSRKPGKL